MDPLSSANDGDPLADTTDSGPLNDLHSKTKSEQPPYHSNDTSEDSNPWTRLDPGPHLNFDYKLEKTEGRSGFVNDNVDGLTNNANSFNGSSSIDDAHQRLLSLDINTTSDHEEEEVTSKVNPYPATNESETENYKSNAEESNAAINYSLNHEEEQSGEEAQVEDVEEEDEEFHYEPSSELAEEPIVSTPPSRPLTIENNSAYIHDCVSVTPTAAFPTPVASAVLGRRNLDSSSEPDNSLDVPALFQSILEECKSGSLPRLQLLFYPKHPPEGYPAPFTLSNTPDPNTSLTPLQFAVSRGNVAVSRFLLKECGAIVDLEDSCGETALHKAAYSGYAALVRLLCEEGDPQACEMPDADGWTPLHNAASRGWLDVVKLLIEDVGVTVDKKSNSGYTPLMNAASKGHLPVVSYLLAKHVCNPFLRNSHGETAYDVAVMSLEMNIADVLAKYEAMFWSTAAPSPDISYNPLSLHLSVAVILHENQRLDLRLKTLAKSLAAREPLRFTSKVLSANDARAPFGIPTTFKGFNEDGTERPVFRSEVGLPLIESPFQVQLPPGTESKQSKAQQSLRALSPGNTHQGSSLSGPSASSSSAAASTSTTPTRSTPMRLTQDTALQERTVDHRERAHFWLSDWFVDLTAPYVDPVEGWQYAKSFHEPPENWSAEMPAELKRLIAEGGSATPGPGIKWVRRRRWCRIMRRRVDRPDLGFPEVINVGEESLNLKVRKLSGPKVTSGSTSSSSVNNNSDSQSPAPIVDDYIEHAKYIAGAHRLGFESDQDNSKALSIASGNTNPDLSRLPKGHIRKIVSTLETAINELESGLADEIDESRRQRAEALLSEYTVRLNTVRESAGTGDVDDDINEDIFIYPSGDTSDNNSLALQSPGDSLNPEGSNVADYFTFMPDMSHNSSFSDTRIPDLSPQLLSASDFQVPSHDVQTSIPSSMRPQPITARSFSGNTRSSIVWEPDDAANDCRRCQRRFNFFTRKHHCRRCGLLVCAACSSNQDLLFPEDVVHEPEDSNLLGTSESQSERRLYRTCDTCHSELEPLNSLNETTESLLSLPVPESPLGSEVSMVSECPVCGINLHQVGGKSDREEHLRECLERGGTVAHNSRYLVFKLTGGPIVDTECLICFEEFQIGDDIGRLLCLCYFHKRCISAWLNRGHGCPLHSRED